MPGVYALSLCCEHYTVFGSTLSALVLCCVLQSPRSNNFPLGSETAPKHKQRRSPTLDGLRNCSGSCTTLQHGTGLEATPRVETLPLSFLTLHLWHLVTQLTNSYVALA